MSEIVQETQPEFWRPPSMMATEVLVAEASPALAESCLRCGTEFLVGSRFCHSCGVHRPEATSNSAIPDAARIVGLWRQSVRWILALFGRFSWRKITLPSWLHYLHFEEIKSWIGLPTASLVAFILGLACVAGALAVGLLTVKTYVDWQAIQFYRGEWLLAATAAFVAGILLKKASASGRD